MNSSQILEFRQNNASNVIQNGDWNNILKKPITINEGDVVRLQSAFIDTRKSSTQSLIIPDDITINITISKYFTDWTNDEENKINYVTTTGSTDLLKYLGKLFIPTKLIPSQDLLDCKIMKSVEYIATDTAQPITVTYKYNNSNKLTVYTNSKLIAPTSGGVYIDNLDLIFDNTAGSPFLIMNTTQELADAGWRIKQQNVENLPDGTNLYEPWQFNIQTTIKAGVYSPDELAIIFSKQISQNPDFQQTDPILFEWAPTYNYLLSVSGEFSQFFLQDGNNPDGTQVNRVEKTVMISTPVDHLFEFKPGDTEYNQGSYFIGTNQFALQYNTDIEKFQFTFTHFPMFDDETGTNIVVRYNANLLDNDWTLVNKNSGVVMNGIYCEDTNGNKINFFEEYLGFDIPSIISKIYLNRTGKIFGDITDSLVYSVNLQEGVNITGAYTGIDTIVIKGKNTWYQAQLLGVDKDDEAIQSWDATSTDTNTIDASVPLSLLLAEQYSHFFIDMNLKFSNSMIGSEDIYNNVQAIVNKYESYGGYVAGDSSSAIEYLHKGSPIVLQGAKVRILNSDHELDDELGSDNTVFIQVIKNINPKTGVDVFNS